MAPQPGPTDPPAQALAASPALFPFSLAPETGAVTFIRLTEADFIRASFLDQRLWLAKAALEAAPT